MNVGFHTGAKIRPVSELSEAEAVAELLGCTVEQAADALRQYDEDFHAERLMRDISESLSADERVEFQAHVRAAMIERPDVPIVEHMLEVAVAIEAERDDDVSLEDRHAAQPVFHMPERLALSAKARVLFVVTATPRPHPPAIDRFLVKLVSALFRCVT